MIPPSYRADLTRPADIYEEVIRMYGFDNIEAKMPIMSIESGEENVNFKMSRIVREILKELGLNEVINYSFIPKFTKDVDEAVQAVDVHHASQDALPAAAGVAQQGRHQNATTSPRILPPKRGRSPYQKRPPRPRRLLFKRGRGRVGGVKSEE